MIKVYLDGQPPTAPLQLLPPKAPEPLPPKVKAFWDYDEDVDSKGINHVLEVLANVCHEKADHIRMSYDDRETARLWERAGNNILGFCASLSKLFDFEP